MNNTNHELHQKDQSILYFTIKSIQIIANNNLVMMYCAYISVYHI